MKLDGYTRLAAVVANPIKHSISPFIHNRAFEATATNGAYVAWEIEAGDLSETVANIRRYQMFGINLSMPYKEQVIPYLDELSDESRLIGAVNTVVNENGNLIGYNTDGKGFFKSLPSFTISGKKMTLLGAGGAAKSIIAQAILDGVSQISVFVRSVSMEKTRPYLTKLQEQTGFKVDLYALEDVSELQARIAESDLLVKVAVMAHTEQDVLDLMNYTRGFKTLNPEQEYVTISMGKVGKVSRITADVTGSSWSFASLDEASAPGQISLASMKKIREILDET